MVKGQAGASLLETYDSERRPVAAVTANQATLLALRLAKGAAVPQEDGAVSDRVMVAARWSEARSDAEDVLSEALDRLLHRPSNG